MWFGSTRVSKGAQGLKDIRATKVFSHLVFLQTPAHPFAHTTLRGTLVSEIVRLMAVHGMLRAERVYVRRKYLGSTISVRSPTPYHW